MHTRTHTMLRMPAQLSDSNVLLSMSELALAPHDTIFSYVQQPGHVALEALLSGAHVLKQHPLIDVAALSHASLMAAQLEGEGLSGGRTVGESVVLVRRLF